ncbi:MAG TPA: AAA family ATPase [Solirubrobacterales bacterium]|nr:AAA family ATPase [Solirubrobacterales bacterium]
MSVGVPPEAASASARRFTIAVRRCKRCAREWPARMDTCSSCAVSLGPPIEVSCLRMVAPSGPPPPEPILAAVLAIELVRREATTGGAWVASAWEQLLELGARGLLHAGAPAGTPVLAWPLARGGLEAAAEFAIRVDREWPRELRGRFERRGAIAVGVFAGSESAVVRHAERLALSAWPGQWLCGTEVARRLEPRYRFGGTGATPRWAMSSPGPTRSFVGRLDPPRMPSAIHGERPGLVLGREAERRRILAELRRPAGRRILLVSAEAGGGKSYLLRSVLADAGLEPRAGIAFPPLGGGPAEPMEALLEELDADGGTARDGDALGVRLGAVASAAARESPALIVVDDVHWADPASLAALRAAILTSDPRAPVIWLLVARTAELGRLRALSALADVGIELPPLRGEDRVRLLEARLGEVPPVLAAHVREGEERGNPLYLEHLAAFLAEGGGADGAILPGDLHEAILARLERLGDRARDLTRWEYRVLGPERQLEELEREVGDWLDRLETSDLADLTTIGRYLGKLRQVDFQLVLARAILGMPVPTSRRLSQAIERLAAASTDALLDYLHVMATGGRATQAAAEAESAAGRAEAALRLADAERLLAFAIGHGREPGKLLCRRGDVALALGSPGAALISYERARRSGERGPALERRVARAEAGTGEVEAAISRLERALGRSSNVDDEADLRLDLARLRGERPPPLVRPAPPGRRRRQARVAALASPADTASVSTAANWLCLEGDPVASSAELVETGALVARAGVAIGGLQAGAEEAARTLGSARALALLRGADPDLARRTFLHAEV